MPYIISTFNDQKGRPHVRVMGKGGALLLGEIEALYPDHPRRIACDLALLVRKRDALAKVLVNGLDADLCCPQNPRLPNVTYSAAS